MRTFKITIDAIRRSVVTVRADSEPQARALAKKIYWDDDHVDVEIDVDPEVQVILTEEVENE